MFDDSDGCLLSCNCSVGEGMCIRGYASRSFQFELIKTLITTRKALCLLDYKGKRPRVTTWQAGSVSVGLTCPIECVMRIVARLKEA
jgi:hypothetical protein